MVERIKKRWENFGLLEDMPEERCDGAAMAYETALDIIMEQDNRKRTQNIFNHNGGELETVMFPVLYRIFKRKQKNKGVDIMDLYNSYKDFIVTPSIIEMIKEINMIPKVDAEAEMLSYFAEGYLLKVNNKKSKIKLKWQKKK